MLKIAEVDLDVKLNMKHLKVIEVKVMTRSMRQSTKYFAAVRNKRN